MELRRPTVTDLGIAGLAVALGAVEVATGRVAGPTSVEAVAVCAYAVAVLVRSTSLWAAVVIGFSTIVVSYGLGVSQHNFMASVVVCLVLVFHVGYGMRAGESALAVMFAYLCVAVSDDPSWENLGWLILVIGGAWAAGRALRNRRVLIEDLRSTTAALEESRDELAQRAVVEDRLRIAQDIHDVVAHSVTVMLVQASVAERLMARDVPSALAAVRSVQDSGRQAFEELRHLLGVLRFAGETTSLTPQPGLADLDSLVGHFRAAGLRVEYDGAPALDGVPPDLALTAFRVAQEGLTNVLRHSTAVAATLRVSAAGPGLMVEVIDPGPARERTGPPGHGLAGMRERVTACGGEVDAHPQGSGFRVTATLPVVALAGAAAEVGHR